MKIKLDQGALLRELSVLQGIIERKGTIPILSNVLLTAAEEGRLTLFATDLEVGFRSSIEAEVSRPGRIAVPARKFYDIAKLLPSGMVDLRADSPSNLVIETEDIYNRLAASDPEQFPNARTREGQPFALIDGGSLSEMIKRVIFAVTSDDPRYSLGGALWELKGDELTMVATDGHRLALAKRYGQNVSKAEVPPMIVPRKALGEIQKMAAEHDGDVYLWSTAGMLFVQFGERELWTSLQEQRFPDYQRVIPRKNDKIFEIPTSSFRDAISRTAVMSADSTHLVQFDLAAGELKLTGKAQALGEARQRLAVDYEPQRDAADLTIGFNGQYLSEFLAVAGTERIRISLGERMGQGLFEPVRPADDTRDDKYVVMPMALP